MKEEGRKRGREKGRNRIMERDRRGEEGETEGELRIVSNRPDFMLGGDSFYDVGVKGDKRRSV